MIYLIESVEVAPGDLGDYLAAFEQHFLPPLRECGLELAGCWHTPADHVEDVTVTALLAARDFAHWNEVRRAGVLSPSLPAWLRARRRYVKRGTRRWHQPASFSPLR